eukprot:235794-Pyramimonas_sp.AAC.1
MTAAPISCRPSGQPPGPRRQVAPRQHVEMQRAMSPARPGRAVDPSQCFGVCPASYWCSQHTVEYQMGSRPCSWARLQRVAPQVQATVAPGDAAGRSHRARHSA